jgi:hypothetical protein
MRAEHVKRPGSGASLAKRRREEKQSYAQFITA